MVKESFYFPHDYDAQNDPKLQALIAKFKSQGYGIFWELKYKYIEFEYVDVTKVWVITNWRYKEHIGQLNYVDKWKTVGISPL